MLILTSLLPSQPVQVAESYLCRASSSFSSSIPSTPPSWPLSMLGGLAFASLASSAGLCGWSWVSSTSVRLPPFLSLPPTPLHAVSLTPVPSSSLDSLANPGPSVREEHLLLHMCQAPWWDLLSEVRREGREGGGGRRLGQRTGVGACLDTSPPLMNIL